MLCMIYIYTVCFGPDHGEEREEPAVPFPGPVLERHGAEQQLAAVSSS